MKWSVRIICYDCPPGCCIDDDEEVEADTKEEAEEKVEEQFDGAPFCYHATALTGEDDNR